MKLALFAAVAALALGSGCQNRERQQDAPPGAVNRQDVIGSAGTEARNAQGVGGAAMPVPEDEGQDASDKARATGTAGILQSSSPADGASLSSAPTDLVLRFSRPVRLNEVTIVGENGLTVPAMITAAGAGERYSVPLPDLEAGRYTAEWRAAGEDGAGYSGTIRFTIR